MKYLYIIERGESSYGAYVPDLPGCVVVGETREETKQLIQEAIEFHIEGLKEGGNPDPHSQFRGRVYRGLVGLRTSYTKGRRLRLPFLV